MKRFSAQYLIDGDGTLLKRPVVTTDNDGTIISVADTGGSLSEMASLTFCNGIIVPGFVNSHCHLELSHFRGKIERGTGLMRFIKSIRALRNNPASSGGGREAAVRHDAAMASEGVVACADISNGTDSFNVKAESGIEYITMTEVFGPDPQEASVIFAEAVKTASLAEEAGMRSYLTPHSLYTLSRQLLDTIKDYRNSREGGVTSLHFLESDQEREMMQLADDGRYRGSHLSGVMNHITGRGNLILVHNTFAGRDEIRALNSFRSDIYWCICPLSNLYISDTLPPVELMMSEGCSILVGSDSLASNDRLSILDELKCLQERFPWLKLTDTIPWATLNGAKALAVDSRYGTFKPGKRPGLLAIEGADLGELRLTGRSRVRRLI